MRRAAALALFVLPFLYVSAVLSTAVHEVFGHGLSAVLLGGEFSGFVLRWDGMGWAYSDLPASAPLWHQTAYLASGIVAGIACGAALLGLALVVSKKPHVQLALLILSFMCLIDSVSYVLWNAYRPLPPGDVGRVLWLWSGSQSPDDAPARWVLLITGALLFAGATFYFSVSIFVCIEALLLDTGLFRGRSRLLALVLFLALPGSLFWFLFDWNQLAPGIGILPCIVGALIQSGVAALLFWYRPRWRHRDAIPSITRGEILVSWMGLIAAVLALALWAADGIVWK